MPTTASMPGSALLLTPSRRCQRCRTPCQIQARHPTQRQIRMHRRLTPDLLRRTRRRHRLRTPMRRLHLLRVHARTAPLWTVDAAPTDCRCRQRYSQRTSQCRTTPVLTPRRSSTGPTVRRLASRDRIPAARTPDEMNRLLLGIPQKPVPLQGPVPVNNPVDQVPYIPQPRGTTGADASTPDPQQVAGLGPPTGDQFNNLFPKYNDPAPAQVPITPVIPQDTPVQQPWEPSQYPGGPALNPRRS